MVNTWSASFPNCFIPTSLFGALRFSFPIYGCVIRNRIWSLLNYFLLIWSNIRKSSIWSKTIFLLFFWRNTNLIKSSIALMSWAICSCRWFLFLSLPKSLIHLFMFSNPKLIIRFILFHFFYFVMRIVITNARDWVGHVFSILIEESFLSNRDFLLSLLGQFSLNLFDWFFKFVCTYARNFPLLLFHFNSLKISVFL